MAEEQVDIKPFPNGPPTLLYQGNFQQPFTLLNAQQPPITPTLYTASQSQVTPTLFTASQSPVNPTLGSVPVNGLPTMFISVPAMTYNTSAPVLSNILQAPIAANVQPPLNHGITPRYDTLKRTVTNQEGNEEMKSPSPKAIKLCAQPKASQSASMLKPTKPSPKRQTARQHLFLDDLPRRQRAQISVEKREEILQFRRDHQLLRQVEIADIFGIDRSTVTKMLKRFSAQLELDNNDESQRAQYELEDVLYRWLSSHRVQNRLTDQQLLQQAHDLHDSCNIEGFTPNLQWLHGFKVRFRLKAKG